MLPTCCYTFVFCFSACLHVECEICRTNLRRLEIRRNGSCAYWQSSARRCAEIRHVARKDLKVKVAGTLIMQGLSLISWFAFSLSGDSTMVIGNLVLSEDAVVP